MSDNFLATGIEDSIFAFNHYYDSSVESGPKPITYITKPGSDENLYTFEEGSSIRLKMSEWLDIAGIDLDKPLNEQVLFFILFRRFLFQFAHLLLDALQHRVRANGSLDYAFRRLGELWCTCFITKTEVLFFLICALKIVIFGREFSLSTFTFHFFIYSFIRFFINTLLLLLLFTRGAAGRRLSCIVDDRSLRCLSVSRTRRT